ncbi:MAG: IclR family transcriptional regulator [Nocardioidaceae bacterium]
MAVTSAGRRGVQSVDRAFELLQLVARADGGAGLTVLAASSGLPVPTIHRILRSLVATGHVVQLASRRYALGPQMIGLGASAARTLETWAQPHLADLAERSGETANLAVLERRQVVYLAQATSSRHNVRMFTEVGSRVSLHCTGVGKALLAHLPPATVRDIVTSTGMQARTRRTITDPEALADELTHVRSAGYAMDDEEQERGVRCVAVVVPGESSTAISVSGPASRLTRTAVRRLAPMVSETARDLAAGLVSPR